MNDAARRREPPRTEPATAARSPSPVGGAERGRNRAKSYPQVPRRDVVQARDHLDQIALELDITGDIGSPETELPRRPENAPQGVGRADVDGSGAVVRTETAPVPQLNANRELASEDASNQGPEGVARHSDAGAAECPVT